MPLYELEEGTSRKYYRIELAGTRIEMHWGRIGTEGSRKTIELPNAVEAEAEYDRQVARRYERGYRLVVNEDVSHNPEKERTTLALSKVVPLGSVPRFLFVNKKKKRFVWIEAEATYVTMAAGVVGREDEVSPERQTHPSARQATAARDAMVAKLMGEGGYELATFSDPEGEEEAGESEKGKVTENKKVKTSTVKQALVRNAELEAHVRESPYDEERWIVLEDWLLEQQDPRAELIQLEKDKSKSGQDIARMRARSLELLFGPKARTITKHLSMIDWRAGFVRECRFDAPQRNAATTAMFEALLAAPALALIRAFDLHFERTEMELLAPVLLAQKNAQSQNHPSFASSICKLGLSFRGATPRPSDVLDHAFLDAFDRLSRLSLTNPGQIPAQPPLRFFRTLTHLEHAPASPDELGRLFCEDMFPKLEELSLDLRQLEAFIPQSRGVGRRTSALRFGDETRKKSSELATFLEGSATPRLEVLTIRWPHAPTVEALLEALASSELLKKLRALNLVSLPSEAKEVATKLVASSHDAFVHVAVTIE